MVRLRGGLSERILEYFRGDPGRWWTVKELTGAVKAKEGTVLRTLHRLDGYGLAESRLDVEGILWRGRDAADEG